MARPWQPACRRRPGRRRAAPRTAPAALRSAGPGPGRARSPPNQAIEHEFESESGMLLTPRWALTPCLGCAGTGTDGAWGTATDSRDNDPRGQQPVGSHSPGTRNPWSALSYGSGHSILVQLAVRRDPAPMDVIEQRLLRLFRN